MSEDPPPPRISIGTLTFRVSVVLVGVLSLLPVADWIPGDPGTEIPPPHWPVYALWIVGLAVLGALAWGLVRVLPGVGAPTKEGRRGRRAARKKGAAQPPPGPAPETPARAPRWLPWVLVAVPALLYAWTSWAVFDGRPLHIDAMTQALQANIYADGALSVPVADDPRFFSSALVIEHQGRAFSQFPPGWSALLAVGFLLGLPWLVAPLCGGLAVYGLYRLLREWGEDERIAVLSAGLLALSPWFVFNAASWMSHVPTLAFILLGSVALVRGMREPRAWQWAAAAGLLLAGATHIRPLEGVAFGLPATVWMLARAVRDPGARRSLAGFALGGVMGIGLLLVYNQVMHGSPTLFGFELQWGPEHRLGFHEAPWGPPHTFLRGFQMLNGYLLALQFLFFDAPAPSLVAALGALLLVRRVDALDRYLLAGCALILFGYLAFWGEGHDLGPRYLIPLAPVVALWSVRFGGILAERTGNPRHRRWGLGLVGLLLASGWILGTPNRWFVYSQSDPLRRLDPGVLQIPEAREALVFLSSPWSIQVQARLRATGMTRQEAQWFYYRVGLCKLDVALSQLEARGVEHPDSVVAALRPLAADSADMVLDPLSGSPGDPFTGLTRADTAAVTLCGLRQYLEENQGGYMLLPFQALVGPTWLEDGPIVAHDLHEENRRLLEVYPDRPAYALQPIRIRGGVREFTLVPLKADSVARVWGEFERLQGEAAVF
ncbi:MAG TPA: glycosyltransferase family 39 protein [Longimicrobiales bacterium]|nr:glycosyltransferase family 39 protein [Longimicrobiales bacterium]